MATAHWSAQSIILINDKQKDIQWYWHFVAKCQYVLLFQCLNRPSQTDTGQTMMRAMTDEIQIMYVRLRPLWNNASSQQTFLSWSILQNDYISLLQWYRVWTQWFVQCLSSQASMNFGRCTKAQAGAPRLRQVHLGSGRCTGAHTAPPWGHTALPPGRCLDTTEILIWQAGAPRGAPSMPNAGLISHKITDNTWCSP